MDKLIELTESIYSFTTLFSIVSSATSIILAFIALVLAHLYYNSTKLSEAATTGILAELRARTDVLSKITDQHFGRLTDIIEKGITPEQKPVLQTAPSLQETPTTGIALPLTPEDEQVLERLNNMFGSDKDAKIHQLLIWGREIANQRLHEIRYRNIFGSQISALLLCDQSGPQNIQSIKNFYDNAKSIYPDSYNNVHFQNWLNFLITSGLATIDNDKVSITPVGHSFLVYLRDNRIPENKMF